MTEQQLIDDVIHLRFRKGKTIREITEEVGEKKTTITRIIRNNKPTGRTIPYRADLVRKVI